MSDKETEPLDPAVAVVHGAAISKKAQDPVILDLRPLTPFTDYFYICHGESLRQNQAIAEAVQEALDRAGLKPYRVEGLESGEWILIDVGAVVIHVFLTRAKRDFYSLERLWADASRASPEAGEEA